MVGVSGKLFGPELAADEFEFAARFAKGDLWGRILRLAPVIGAKATLFEDIIWLTTPTRTGFVKMQK